MAISDTGNNKVKVFITIDTEDKYFDIPRFITGEGIEGNPGVGMIMDILDKHKCKGNFFLNVYEHINYKEGVLKNIAKEIYKRGHEVELHTHANENSDIFKRNIFKYSLEDQIKILDYGKNLIYDWVGINPVAHRGGSYCCDDNTLKALYRVGIPIDSSFWLDTPNNLFTEKFTSNRVASYNNIIEVPITYVDYVKSNGVHGASKLDIDWLDENELIEVIEQAKKNNLKSLTLFLHSFTFTKKVNKDVSEQSDPKAIFVSKPIWGRLCAQILGIDEIKINRFDKIVDYICKDKELEVCTFKDWYKADSFLKDLGEDFIPVINQC